MKPKKFARFRMALLVPLVGLLVGCGEGQDLVPVEGKVLNGDQPLTTGTVMYYPDAEQGNTSSAIPRSEISSDGSYSLVTNQQKGAPAGWYKVTVTAQEEASGEDPYAPRPYLVQEKYLQNEKTPISIEIKSSASPSDYELMLDPK